MSRFAALVPVQKHTRDHRTIRWLECELHDGDDVRRETFHPFFDLVEMRSWAGARGYQVRD